MDLPVLDSFKKLSSEDQLLLVYMILLDQNKRLARLEGFNLGALIIIAIGFIGGLFALMGMKGN